MIPTITFITASGTYNTPANCKYIKVYIVSGGGGGGGGGVEKGSGGGAGGVLLKYFLPGSYSVVIGTGGAGGGVGGMGANSLRSSFGGFFASSARGGVNSNFASVGGFTAEFFGQIDIPGFPGQPASIRFSDRSSGNGGMNIFSSNGRGGYLSSGATGISGGSGTNGGGGAGALGLSGIGGAGGNGFVRVIEYY
jgi:hypothetical protein